ncbi:thiaminase II, partial [Staphylococcus pseudintermedius]
QYAPQFCISEKELESMHPASKTLAYKSYMLNLAPRGGVDNVIAALLTGTWSFPDIVEALNQIGGAAKHSF